VRLRALGGTLLVLALNACGAESNQVLDLGPDASLVEVPAEEVQIVASSDALAMVLDMEVLPRGDFWVLNSIAPFFIGFDSTGAQIALHGTQGGGPEEFPLPVGFVTGGLDDEVWVLDVRRHSLIRISTPDRPWSELPLPRESLPPGSVAGGMDLLNPTVRTARLGERVILPRLPADRGEGVLGMIGSILKVDLVGLDPSGGGVEDLVPLRDVLDDPYVGFEATAGGFPLWRRLWSVCGGDELAVYDREANIIRRFDAAGSALEPLRLPPAQPMSVTPRQFARAVFGLRQAEASGTVDGRLSPADSARMLNEMVQEVRGTGPQLAAYLPRYVDFRCTGAGTLWLRPIDLEAGGMAGGRTWLRIDADGHRTSVRFPDRFDPLRFTETRVWGVQRDLFDVVSIAWAALP
jgi:hypothetical protein